MNYFLSLITALLTLTTTLWSGETLAQGVKVIVIDPGHGGKFPGASYKGVTEKELNLKIALQLGDMIKKAHPEVKVIYTRTKDIALGTTLSADLGARNKIANNAKGDLFISIHANAAVSASAQGAETIIMGESSLEEQRNYNALYTANRDEIIDMSNEKNAAIVRAYIENYQYTYGQYSEALARLVQKGYAKNGRNTRPLRRQPLMVLYGTDMPCILTEVGFMSNPSEFAFLCSSRGQATIARSIFDGVDEYIKLMAKLNNGSSTKLPESNTALKKGYTVQILSTDSKLKENDRAFKSFAGQQWVKIGSGKFKYKYCIGKYATREEASRALPQIKREFKDAFITNF
ncbi:MAG: N-acetylmuramoyl-L-alanine amidase [Rikenellaceae bacterium]